jgi:LacI family transcriptional regulator, repressor for deo operon, udp, cdd, tsx, nupC, and nupG
MVQLDSLTVDPRSSIPLSHQLKQQLTWLIASQALKPGDRLPPVRELANRLSVNLHTVRQAYLKLEAEGMVETRRGRGTHVLALDPVCMLQAAGSQRSHTVGVILPTIVNPFYHGFMQGVSEVADDDKTLLFLCTTGDDPGEAWRYFAQLASRQVDGVIVVSHDIYNIFPGAGERLAQASAILPIVTVDWPDCTGVCVQIDLETAGYLATRHLLEHDHRRVGLITFTRDDANVLPVNAGYQRALSEAGIRIDVNLIARQYSFEMESGEDGARKLLSLEQPPTAIFAISDLLALGAMRAIKVAGLRVPQDIAVAGFNDIPMAEMVDPPLTTVKAPVETAGREAMKMVRQLILKKRPLQDRLVLQTHLVVRQSCGCGGVL